jgi:zinc protease
VKRSLLILFLLCSLLAPSALMGAQGRAPRRIPVPQSAPVAATAHLPEAKLVNQVLVNGLEVIVLEDHSVPLVTIELAVKNGSYTEPPELNGLSHLYEHMFFKANRAIASAEEYLQKIGQLGITYNGQTREEVVNYYFTTTSPNLKTAMNFMRDAARYPLFNEAEFERERQVVIGEIDRNESNPFFYLNREMNDRLFYKYPVS